MAQERAVRHHTVPRFYLERFADQRRQVMRVVLPGDQRHRTSINDASVVRDFYTIHTDEGPSDEFERVLASVETNAATAFRSVLDDRVWPPDEETRWALSWWAAVQALRTTAVRQSADDILNLWMKLEVGAGGKERLRSRMEEALDRAVEDDELDRTWDEYTGPSGPGFESGPDQHVDTIMRLAPGTAHMFHDRSWALVRFTRRPLATSDSPVTLVPDLRNPDLAVGFATAMHVVVPMDRRTLLLMGDLDKPTVEIPPSTQVATYANTMVAAFATRALFHHPEDDPLRGIPLPRPREHQIHANVDDLISEQGLFATSETDQPSEDDSTGPAEERVEDPELT